MYCNKESLKVRNKNFKKIILSELHKKNHTNIMITVLEIKLILFNDEWSFKILSELKI